MKNASHFAKLFKTGQYGNMYIVSGSHPRGKTFHIQILPENEKAISNGPNNLCLNTNAVEVYGIVKGLPGWTEEYGWIHRGPWVKDFMLLAQAKADAISRTRKKQEYKNRMHYVNKRLNEKKLLQNYKSQTLPLNES